MEMSLSNFSPHNAVKAAPYVFIEEETSPYNGTVFNVSCIVRLDSSMDSAVVISSEWTLPADPDTARAFYFTERVSKIEHRNTLTFAPLSSRDSGVYVCHANVSGGSEFVTGTAHSQATHTLSVESEYIIL